MKQILVRDTRWTNFINDPNLGQIPNPEPLITGLLIAFVSVENELIALVLQDNKIVKLPEKFMKIISS